MALTVFAGFENGTDAGMAAGTSGHKIWDVKSGVTISSTSPRSGDYSMQIDLSGANHVKWNTSTLGAGNTVLVGSFYFYLSTDPTGTTVLASFDTAATGLDLSFEYEPTGTNADKIHLWNGATSTGAYSSVTCAPNTWHRIDYRIDVASNPHTLDWQVNGTAQTQFTWAVAGSTIAAVTYGVTFAGLSGVCRYDDIVQSVTSGDYPLGEHSIKPLTVDTGGTVTLSGTTANFNVFSGATPTLAAWNATTARDRIDERPPNLGSAQDGFCQITTATGDYVQIPMTTYTLQSGETIEGVRMIAAGWAASTTAATLGFRSYNGTTETILLAGTVDPGFDNTATPGWVAKMLTLADVNTQSELDALAFRVGFSSDAAPDIGIHAIYAEVAVKPASSTPQTDSDTSSGADTHTAYTATYTIADTSSGAETPTLTSTYTGTDTSSSVESQVLAQAKVGEDTGSDVEAQTLTSTYNVPDTSNAAESPTLTGTLTNQETSTGAEASSQIATHTSSDTASGTDAMSVLGKPGVDTSSGVELPALTVTLTGTDLSSSVDNTSLVGKPGADTSAGAEAPTLTVSLSGTDTSSGVEAHNLSQGDDKNDSDLSTSVEGPSLTVTLSGVDTGTSQESSDLFAPQDYSDTDPCSSVEVPALTVTLSSSDSRTIGENESLMTPEMLVESVPVVRGGKSRRGELTGYNPVEYVIQKGHR